MRPVILAQKITLKTGSKPKYSQVFPNPCPTKQLYAMVDNLTTSDVQVYMDDNVTTGGNHVYPDPSPTAVKAGASVTASALMVPLHSGLSVQVIWRLTAMYGFI